MKKISQWIIDETDSHGAYNCAALRVDFEHETGEKWPDYLSGTKARELKPSVGKSPKGLVELNAPDEARIIAGWVVARALADSFAGFRSNKMGRGFEWRECVQALKDAGK